MYAYVVMSVFVLINKLRLRSGITASKQVNPTVKEKTSKVKRALK